MLKQKQALKPVKSGLHSKNWEIYLVGNLIKSKLYLLILLTVSTGGIFIGNTIVTEQISLAQPFQRRNSNYTLTRNSNHTLEIFGQGGIRSQVLKIRSGDTVTWICERPSYSTPGEHTLSFSPSYVYRVTYNQPLTLTFVQEGRYRYFVDGADYYIDVSR